MKKIIFIFFLLSIGCTSDSVEERIKKCHELGLDEISLSANEGLYFGNNYYVSCRRGN